MTEKDVKRMRTLIRDLSNYFHTIQLERLLQRADKEL